MNQKRFDPLGICADAADSGSKAVTSRLDLVSTNLCTVCGRQMHPILAHEIPAFVCWDHRVVLPQENPTAAVVGEPAAPVAQSPMPIFSGQQTEPLASKAD